MVAVARRLLLGAAALSFAACSTTGNTPPRPATLTDASPAMLEALSGQLSSIIGEGRVRLGPSDLTRDPVIAVLPPPPGPYEGNSPAMPRYFDLMTDGKSCSVLDRKTGVLHPLAGVACRPK